MLRRLLKKVGRPWRVLQRMGVWISCICFYGNTQEHLSWRRNAKRLRAWRRDRGTMSSASFYGVGTTLRRRTQLSTLLIILRGLSIKPHASKYLVTNMKFTWIEDNQVISVNRRTTTRGF
jgi:hypothetical protein